MTYRSIHDTSPSTYSRVSPLLPTWHPDDGCSLLPNIIWTFRPFVSLQSASRRFRFLVPPSERPASFRLRNDLYCVGWNVKLYSLLPLLSPLPPRRICDITRGFQTMTQDLSVFRFLPRHYHMTYVLPLLFITAVWYCLDTCGPCDN